MLKRAWVVARLEPPEEGLQFPDRLIQLPQLRQQRQHPGGIDVPQPVIQMGMKRHAGGIDGCGVRRELSDQPGRLFKCFAIARELGPDRGGPIFRFFQPPQVAAPQQILFIGAHAKDSITPGAIGKEGI